MGPWSLPLPQLLTSTSGHLPVQLFLPLPMQLFLPILRKQLPALPMLESTGCLYQELDSAVVEPCAAQHERPLSHGSIRTYSQSCWGQHTGLGVRGLQPCWLRAVLGLFQPLPVPS